MSTFHDRLRWAVARIGGQNELARRIHTSPGTVSPWFDKETPTWPAGKFWPLFPSALEVDGHWLLTGQGDPKKGMRGRFSDGVRHARVAIAETLADLAGKP